MARMKFYCDAERCIECNGCVTACKNENDVPWGVNRRRVVTIKDGEVGERIQIPGIDFDRSPVVEDRLVDHSLLLREEPEEEARTCALRIGGERRREPLPGPGQ